jgi:hypothetical protein
VDYPLPRTPYRGQAHTSAGPKLPEAVQAIVMRAGIVVNVMLEDRRRLEAIVSDRNAPVKPPNVIGAGQRPIEGGH